MIITVTGTPGTGKTSITREMARQEGYSVIDLTDFARERELGEQREEFEVDLEKLREALKEELGGKSGEEDYVIDGHLSHHFNADYCVVLRCKPEELEKRLENRNYSSEKVEENVESEALDVVLQEAAEKQENIIEIDTTGREPGDVAAEAVERIENDDDDGYGDVDWSDYF